MNVCDVCEFWSKVRTRTFRCVGVGSEVLFILRYRFRRVQSEHSASCFVWIQREIVMFCQGETFM